MAASKAKASEKRTTKNVTAGLDFRIRLFPIVYGLHRGWADGGELADGAFELFPAGLLIL